MDSDKRRFNPPPRPPGRALLPQRQRPRTARTTRTPPPILIMADCKVWPSARSGRPQGLPQRGKSTQPSGCPENLRGYPGSTVQAYSPRPSAPTPQTPGPAPPTPPWPGPHNIAKTPPPSGDNSPASRGSRWDRPAATPAIEQTPVWPAAKGDFWVGSQRQTQFGIS